MLASGTERLATQFLLTIQPLCMFARNLRHTVFIVSITVGSDGLHQPAQRDVTGIGTRPPPRDSGRHQYGASQHASSLGNFFFSLDSCLASRPAQQSLKSDLPQHKAIVVPIE